ncbi:hypothetical protein DL990_20155 [Amycolatopsis sp. WAC 01416]|uniref:sulfite exporter TauE/SafE family protein n=1 Tax=Amycolatopsis sp. WAC 01416 TaxID=2203196 RepID=UPI000F76FFC5|nr:sulfite exporter TauE/SafE family protein [Amycolatopsis sp. WAC 01416]RSN32231.1 hypothetical protein DL990_20155 [Amycolatopsis sp. WAC 01416]
MSYFSDRAEQAREDKRVKAELARKEKEQGFDQRLALTRLQLEETRKDKADTRADRKEKRQARVTAVKGLWSWCAAHVVDLLIYPLMLVSAALTIPGVAHWGGEHLGSEVGLLLPLLSEWGMVAFSVAVHVQRVRHPDRPVWALQLGVLVFSGYGLVISVIRGITMPGGNLGIGVVMGLVSVAGVIAHQIVTAAPRRSTAEKALRRTAKETARQEKAAARTVRAERDRVEAARRAAIRSAVAEIGPDGAARLVFQPGLFQLGRRGRLAPATVSNLPVSTAGDGELSVADEAAAYLAGAHFRRLESGASEATPDGERGRDAAGVATLDPKPEPRPRADDHTGDDPAGDDGPKRPSAARRTGGRRSARATIPEPKKRTPEQLKTEFAKALDDRPAGFDPLNAESIRRTLKCGKKQATDLKADYVARNGGDA